MPDTEAAARPPSGRPTDGADPRSPEPSEFPSLFNLLDDVFRSGSGSMAAEFPRLLCETNRSNLCVIAENGRVVSHVGTIVRDATLSGACVRVALLGAVATAEDARGKGYATKCMRAICEHAIADGVDFVIISGSRGLYTRLGSRPVGDDIELCITKEQASSLARGGIEVRSFGEEHLPEAVDLYAGEGVRFVRPLEDWRAVMPSGYVSCKKCTFLGAWEVGRLAAYVIAIEPNEEGTSFVAEYAGARGVLIGALREIMDHTGAEKLKLRLGHHDKVLGARLAAAGIDGRATHSNGTVLVLNFESLMGKLRTRFLERAGESAAKELSFAEEGPPLGPENTFRIANGPDVVRIKGRGPLAEFIFGTPGCSSSGERPASEPPSGQEESSLKLWGASWPFRAALPAPTLSYGLNFT